MCRDKKKFPPWIGARMKSIGKGSQPAYSSILFPFNHKWMAFNQVDYLEQIATFRQLLILWHSMISYVSYLARNEITFIWCWVHYFSILIQSLISYPFTSKQKHSEYRAAKTDLKINCWHGINRRSGGWLPNVLESSRFLPVHYCITPLPRFEVII